MATAGCGSSSIRDIIAEGVSRVFGCLAMSSAADWFEGGRGLQMKVRPKWLSPAIEVGAGVVVGYATWRLTDPGDPVVGLLSVAVGLLTVLVVASLNRHAVEESRAKALDA